MDTIVLSSTDASMDASFIGKCFRGFYVHVFDSQIWIAVAQRFPEFDTSQQILKDLVEIQMMRDASIFIGSKSSMSLNVFKWRAIVRKEFACNVYSQPCERMPNYRDLHDRARLSCLRGPRELSSLGDASCK
jgi:hypothetical protein